MSDKLTIYDALAYAGPHPLIGERIAWPLGGLLTTAGKIDVGKVILTTRKIVADGYSLVATDCEGDGVPPLETHEDLLAAIPRECRILEVMRAMNTKLRIGAFGWYPRYGHGHGLVKYLRNPKGNLKIAQAWDADNTIARAVVEVSDVVYPCIYPYFADYESWELDARAMIGTALATCKPVVPWYTPFWHGPRVTGDYVLDAQPCFDRVPLDHVVGAMRLFRDMGCAAVAFWGGGWTSVGGKGGTYRPWDSRDDEWFAVVRRLTE